MNATTRFVMIVSLLQGILSMSRVAAQDREQDARYLSVTAVGTASVMPDTMELMGIVRGEGELAGDALTEFLAVGKAATDKLQSLGICGMTVASKGLAVGQGLDGNSAAERMERMLAARNGRAPEPAKVSLSERLDIRIEGIDQLSRDELLATIVKIVDAGNEAGITFGRPKSEIERIQLGAESGFVLFRLADPGTVQEKAREAAMQEARKTAAKWADLAGMTLGPVVSIDDMDTSAFVASSMRSEPYTSTACEEIDVKVQVRVRFEVTADLP